MTLKFTNKFQTSTTCPLHHHDKHGKYLDLGKFSFCIALVRKKKSVLMEKKELRETVYYILLHQYLYNLHTYDHQ